ncbi:hypothetical protein LSH36_278g02060 [Paralvinella palmiformis]|uniref:Galactose mutarotase n=1 Tax=Paralvinella palmiformis TaxID=53620 RepID=A0AAD9N4J5_9ANNE|nr:hypothetical protein LSH36_278g02060 [Paralvinella palmiformis]
MGLDKCEQCYEHQALNRNVFNYVKWKHRAEKSRQYLIMATIFMVASLSGVLLFVLLISGVIRVPQTDNSTSKVSIIKEEFGITREGVKIDRYTLRSIANASIEIQVLTLGCTITSIKVPDDKGQVDDIILGFDDLIGYERTDNPYLGAVLGRVANRINKGTFKLNNQIYHLPINDGDNHLNGGHSGWNKAVWNATVVEDQLTFSYISDDGDENFPGEIHANVTFRLTKEDELIIRFTAEIREKMSPINMAIQPFFNLAGEGSDSIYNHEVTIFADYYLPTKLDLLPTEIYTDQPAIHFYTANSLDIKHGKSGHDYGKHSGFSMVPQNYPDAINHDTFPDSVLYPGSTYIHTSWYKFTTAD